MCDLMLCILAVAVGCSCAWAVAHHHERRYTAMREHQARDMLSGGSR